MFVRKKHNKSGTISIQIIDKSTGQYRVVKSLGASKDPKRIEYLWRQAHVLIPELTGQISFDFQTENDKAVDQYMSNTNSLKVRVVGPEIVFGSLFDDIGFNKIEDELFRHLVITRLVYPGSKLKTAVTGTVKKGSKAAGRRKSFCARSKGWKGERGLAARRRWKC